MIDSEGTTGLTGLPSIYHSLKSLVVRSFSIIDACHVQIPDMWKITFHAFSILITRNFTDRWKAIKWLYLLWSTVDACKMKELFGSIYGVRLEGFVNVKAKEIGVQLNSNLFLNRTLSLTEEIKSVNFHIQSTTLIISQSYSK